MIKNKKVFVNTLIAIVLLEALSFIAYSNPWLNPWIFGIVSIAIIIATVYKLEYGVFIAIAELIIGSLGRMMVLELNGADVSLRMAIWIIVLCVWLARVIKKKEISFFKSQLFVPFMMLSAIILWGIIWGAMRGNNLGLIFNDANNYFYFALIFPVYGVLRSRKIVERLHYVITAAILFLALKTIALFYIFSHEFFYIQDVLYSWLRAARLAEVTNIDPNILLSRIFMQSQIWLVFLSFAYLVASLKNIIPFIFKNKSRAAVFLVLLALPMSAIIISFSRSFWLAWIIAFVVFAGFYFVRRLKKGLKKFFIFIGLTCAVVLASIGLTLGVASFPIPKGAASADLLRDRAGKFTGEAALSSRYAQIRPMLNVISAHPVLGSGFGTSATYESQDPRVLKDHPDGKYTTTAFELGWLEIWLKMGLLGVLIYLYLLYSICKIGYERINRIASVEIKKYALAGLCVGLIAVALTHGVSPYLNHPLGIGIVIICASLVDKKHV